MTDNVLLRPFPSYAIGVENNLGRAQLAGHNRRRYKAYTLGMALSGPDTGGSQWFITLNPQPHLDGGYTVFGQVTGGAPVLLRITQGDLIRTIRR